MRPIFFLHLHKTGGQTLATRMASAFRPDRVHLIEPGLHWPQHRADLARLLETHDFIESHVHGPLLAEHEGIDILSAVRDPVERLVSAYKHTRREKKIKLHRAALTLTPQRFFDNFGDTLANQQTRALLHALLPCDLSVHAAGHYQPWLMRQLPAALSRIRWLPPTEAIDEFCLLWARDTGHFPVAREIVVNTARPDEREDWELRRIVQARPELTALDSVLWTEARRWWRGWREAQLLAGVSRRGPGTLAYEANDEALWLTEGWLPTPRLQDGRQEWWAGPDRRSIIEFRRGAARWLVVDIAVIIGLERERIGAFAGPDFARLPTRLEGNGTLRVDLEGLPQEGRVVLAVPEVYSAIQVFAEDSDSTRRSFATNNWRLER